MSRFKSAFQIIWQENKMYFVNEQYVLKWNRHIWNAVHNETSSRVTTMSNQRITNLLCTSDGVKNPVSSKNNIRESNHYIESCCSNRYIGIRAVKMQAQHLSRFYYVESWNNICTFIRLQFLTFYTNTRSELPLDNLTRIIWVESIANGIVQHSGDSINQK